MIRSRSGGSEQIAYSRAALSIQSCGVHVTDYKPDWRHWWQRRLRERAATFEDVRKQFIRNAQLKQTFDVIRKMVYDREIILAWIKREIEIG